ncbi:MAG: hypothetical protein ACI88G_002401 [Woeseiaceae bacterium]|jgi:hypothetical protein
MMGQYNAEKTQLNDGRVLQFRILSDDTPLSWSTVTNRWQTDQSFRTFFMSLLNDAPFPAYFWETPPITNATTGDEFEFVLVDSPQLTNINTDQQAFANQFVMTTAGESVIEFANLGGDATLVVPCLRGSQSAYSQLSTFARLAPQDQQHQLWKMVGATLERRLSAQPVWLSTSGLGVYWVHIRFDAEPKYYTHEPYRHI